MEEFQSDKYDVGCSGAQTRASHKKQSMISINEVGPPTMLSTQCLCAGRPFKRDRSALISSRDTMVTVPSSLSSASELYIGQVEASSAEEEEAYTTSVTKRVTCLRLRGHCCTRRHRCDVRILSVSVLWESVAVFLWFCTDPWSHSAEQTFGLLAGLLFVTYLDFANPKRDKEKRHKMASKQTQTDNPLTN
ncbi:hypothetical protein BaRGS_00012926 [Batillaria attramentaria]|uniref:Uncharacterized protein n=1 Tax=Batillaria attramentaria TaxID=370345 RepID=A0ABD0L9H2_9CAEN